VSLNKHGLGVFPAYLCEGMEPREQVVLTWIWSFHLWGEDYTFKKLSEKCGCASGALRKLCDKLVEKGVLAVVPEEDRPNGKASNEYMVVADWIGDRPVKAPQPVVKAHKFPGWVFTARKIWMDSKGIIRPAEMKTALEPAIQEYGIEKVLDALVRYTERSDPKFFPHPRKMALEINQWIDGGAVTTAESASFTGEE